MSKSIIGEHLWAEMTEVQKVEAVRKGRATLKQMTEGLLDGSDDLRNACRDFLAHTDASLGDISVEANVPASRSQRKTPSRRVPASRKRISKSKRRTPRTKNPKLRFGLPVGFTRRVDRYGRTVLLEDNVYRLPNGLEFIPQHPTGTLGKLSHLYALLTLEQYSTAKRGSVYIRTDGRVFDYSVDHGDPERDMFDTGYTMADLERTGRYASQPRVTTKQPELNKHRRAAHAG